MAVGDLRPDERWLVQEVEAGRPATFDARAADKPEIRAEILRQLALSATRPQGMEVRNARILGSFDLAFAEVKGPLTLLACEFSDVVRLENALLVNIDLRNSTFPGLRAGSADIKHDLILQGCAGGTVRLIGARIGGDLDLRAASLSGTDGMALVADRSTIGGALLAHAGFTATGEVRLVRATITGVVNLNGAKLTHPGKTAISLDGARMNGGMFCADGFRAEGEVRLAGATVERVLELSTGSVRNPGRTALMVDAARVEGSVLCRGFIAAGRASFSGASIAGLLDLDGGSFGHPDKVAVDLTQARVGHLRLKEAGTACAGEINLSRTHIGSLEDAPQAWAPFSPVSLLGCTYEQVNDDGWTARGRLSWLEQDPEYRAQSYEQLAKALRAQGHEAEARAVMVAKYRRRRDSQEWYRKPLEYLFDVLLVYGYRPLQRTLPALVVLYLLGAALLLPQARDAGAVIATRTPVSAQSSGQADPADPQASGPAGQPGSPSARDAIVAGSGCPQNYPCFSPWRYAADVVIPLINTRQTEYWTVTAATSAGERAVWYNTAAAALGWFLTTAAALGFTGLIRRD
jgi:uncharacterized protein YjbI with pentapeptide repeats